MESDKEVLISFFHATNGESWDTSKTWLGHRPIGEWEGVTTDDGGRVTGLKLVNLGLTGMIPPEIVNLVKLRELDLGYNQLSGGIPPELGALSNLSRLTLRYNGLGGELPPELGNLAKLRVLSVIDNQISGVIPPELGNLSNLQLLVVGGNELTGEIPVELNNLASLVRLSLSANRFTGCYSDYLREFTADLLPVCVTADNSKDTEALIALYDAWAEPDLENWLTRDPLGDWEGVSVDHRGRVVRLQLPGKGLSGILPPELGDLTQLSWVDLSYNDFGGQIPPEWGKLSELRTLLLDSNRLSGEIPTELTNSHSTARTKSIR